MVLNHDLFKTANMVKFGRMVVVLYYALTTHASKKNELTIRSFFCEKKLISCLLY